MKSSTLLAIILALLLAAPVSAATHTPKDGPALVAIEKTAAPCDIIELTPGVRYVVGTWELTKRPESATCRLVIRTSGTLPDRRIAPADAPLLATIAADNIGPSTNVIGTGNVTFQGLRFEPTSTGYDQVIVNQNAYNVTYDRILLIAGPNGQKRGIALNGRNMEVSRSYIAGIWANTLQDSQAICAWDGAGPYRILDNYLEAASENLMFGGANSLSAANIPSDILVENNRFAKPLSWKADKQERNIGRAVKNLFELKSAKRVTIRNNVFENNWTDAQNGYSILMTGRNDEGQSPWSVVEDVLFERNIVRNVENGINILGYDTYQPSGRTQRITIRNNLVITSGTALQFGSEVGALTLDRNTFVNGGTLLLLYKGSVRVAPDPTLRPATFAVEGLVLTNNIGFHNDYGVIAEDFGIGTKGLAGINKGYTWTNNALAGDERGDYPATTTWVSVAALRALWGTSGDYRLPDTSDLATKGLGWSGLGASTTPPPPPPPPDEICGNKIDDDGDGQVDEGCQPDPLPPPVPTDTQLPVIISATVVRSGASSNYTATVKAEDNVAVARIEYWIDGVWTDMMSAPSTEPNTYARKLRIVTPGAHVLKVVVKDAAGNATTTEQPVKR